MYTDIWLQYSVACGITGIIVQSYIFLYCKGKSLVHSYNPITINGPITKLSKIFFHTVTDEFNFNKEAKS
jgi:hypothetical protein